MIGGIKIVQINLHHCSDASDTLVRYVEKNDLLFCLCQDPYLFDGCPAGFSPDWLSFSSLSGSAVIFCTDKSMKCVLSLQTNHSVFITVTLTKYAIVLGSVYSAPSSNIDLDMSCWINHFKDCSRLLVGGDFNVPLLTFGYTREEERSEIFREYLMISCLRILNDPTAPHSYQQDDRKGRPDLTLAGVELLQYLDNWCVDDKFFSFSDHKYITFELKLNILSSRILRFKTKNKSMKKFNRIFGENYDKLFTTLERVQNVDGLEDWVVNFDDYLQFVLHKCFKKGPINHRPTTDWYTPQLRSERNKVNALYKRYTRNLATPGYREAYILARRHYKSNLRIAKKKAWINFCNKTNDSYGNLYKYISGKRLNHSDLTFTTFENSSVFSGYDDIAASLMETHFDIHDDPVIKHEYVSDRDYGTDTDFIKFSRRELMHAIKCQNNKKAPGADDVDAIVVKNLCFSYVNLMLLLFNTCLRFGHFPTSWKRGMIIFFRKRNRPDQDPKSYRPITLLPIIAKVYERMLKLRILTLLESSNYLNDHQHGFREGRSTLTALSSLKALVKEKLSIFKYCAMISFDITGAFDVLDWWIASRAIDDLPIYGYLKSAFKNFISTRKIGFRFLRGIRWFRIYRGCPQGSCMGPLIWTIVADLILKNCRSLMMDLISYADDSTVIDGANTRSALEYRMNQHARNFVSACRDLNLNINPDKTVSMLFGSKTFKKRRPIFKIGEKRIPVKDNILYLGFTLDSVFNWMEHLDVVRSKLTNFTCNIRKTRIRDQGISLSHLKIWNNTVLMKQISYGHEIWFSDLKYHSLQRLSSCQRVCLLAIVRAYRTTSTDALCVLAGIPPIRLQLSVSSLKYQVVHSVRSTHLNGYEISSSLLNRKCLSFEYPLYYDSHHANFLTADYSRVKTRNWPTIFTDGSKMQEGVSAAFTVLINRNILYEKRIKLANFNSVYQAELVAILHAIDWARSTAFRVIYLFTDSYSSFCSLQRLFPSDILLYRIFENLRMLCNKIVHIGWVKAHRGTFGNERADYLAKSVITEDIFDCEEEVPMPMSFFNSLLSRKLLADWQQYWDISENGRFTYGLLNRVSLNFMCYSQICVYFYTGHGAFPSYLKKINKSNTDRCICGAVGDVAHYLFASCQVSREKFDFIYNRTKEWNIKSVLASRSNHNKLRIIYNNLNQHFSFIRYKF